MKQPLITYEGKVYKITQISWYKKGGLCNVSFTDSNGIFNTVFQKLSWEKEGRGENGILRLELANHVKWGDTTCQTTQS